MPPHTKPDGTLGLSLFPNFSSILSMTSKEVTHLTDQQLDWTSDNWEWSKWSIRRQISHLASTLFVWLLHRWGPQLFPQGYSELKGLDDHSLAPGGRWLDENKYWDLSVLLGELGRAMDVAKHILKSETVVSMRQKELERTNTQAHWGQFATLHHTGFRWHDVNPNISYMTLEATFRHIYFGAITHIYNIQRLKRAQGISASVKIPHEGYWTLPTWDRSEP